MAFFYIDGSVLKLYEGSWLKWCPGPLCAKEGVEAYPGAGITGRWHPTTEFDKNAARKDGLAAYCKLCKEYTRKEKQ